MSIAYHERPGVYSDVDASSVYASAIRNKTIALVGICPASAGLYTVTDCASGLEVFGAESQLGKMLTLACQNGAGTVLCCPVATDTSAAYEAAFQFLRQSRQAAYIAIGSHLEAVQLLLQELVMDLSAEKGECIGVVGMAAPSTLELKNRAARLNCERMVLVGPDVVLTGGSDPAGGEYAAAALCGALAAQEDPALPLNAQALRGLSGVSASYNDTEIDTLVRGGVTILELQGSEVTVMRGITSRSTTGGAPDLTWRELTTTLILDDVVPAVRNTLRARFVRAKNNAATRAAIRSQVVVVLEDRVQRQIIEDYGPINVYPDTTDPTICVVDFAFTVCHGLNRIHLSAHVSV